MNRRAGDGWDELVEARTERLIKQVGLLDPGDVREPIETVLGEVADFISFRIVVTASRDDLESCGLTVLEADDDGEAVVSPTRPLREDFGKLLNHRLGELDAAIAVVVHSRTSTAGLRATAPDSQQDIADVLNARDRLREGLIDELAELQTLRMLSMSPEPAVAGRLATNIAAMQKRLQQRHLQELNQRYSAATEEFERSARALAEVAGEKGTSTLAEHFDKYATSARWEALIWQFATTAILGASVWSTYEHIASVPGFDWLDIAQRLTVGLPVAVLVTFAAHEASIHRHHGMWARHLAVQLKSVRAYTAELPFDQRMALQTALGKRAFDSPPEPGPSLRRRNVRRVDSAGLRSQDLPGDEEPL